VAAQYLALASFVPFAKHSGHGLDVLRYLDLSRE